MCIHCLLREQKCRLKSTTTNGWRHFGQSEQRKSSALFPIQSEKSPDSGIFTCHPTKKCIMPSSRERRKGIIGRGHDLRLLGLRLSYFLRIRVYCYVKSFWYNRDGFISISHQRLVCRIIRRRSAFNRLFRPILKTFQGIYKSSIKADPNRIIFSSGVFGAS